MKRVIFILVFFFAGISISVSQNKDKEGNAIPEVVDSLYREDQFYIGLSFNLINNEPKGFSQNGFSGGLHLGFIRDMPFNKRRNKAIGVGLGLSVNSYNSNLFISQSNTNSTIYDLLEDDDNADSNRFFTNLVEMPIQYRWRTSTTTETSFWRIYTGVKLGYLYGFKSSFKNPNGTIEVRNPDGLDRWRYAATLTIGNGSFNAFFQYNLNTLFRDSRLIDGSRIGLQPIKFGIEFYLL
jgi:hypothetical protein